MFAHVQGACLLPTSSMDALNSNRTLLPQSSAKSAAPVDQKARGANRSTKIAGKLKVLPDQPDVPTQSQILSEPPKPAPPPTTSTGTPGSDDDDAEDEDEPEEPEEQDAEVCCSPPRFSSGTDGNRPPGVQPNSADSGGHSETRCDSAHEKESKVSSESNCVCYSWVRDIHFFFVEVEHL